MDQTLTATLDRRAGLTVLTLVGDIDHDARPMLDRLLAGLPEPLGRLRVDMRGVAFMDSAGLHFLAELHRRQSGAGDGAPTLVGIRQQPADVLRMTGMDALLTMAA
ncbi:STAS domain-containing protein [Streptomyces sp. NPDC001380]|uniref:STAS domain-containing protein n=1 Tax=Streptomyces sp. NPDC001380 TaxID=3364566 RepID=UPI003674F834